MEFRILGPIEVTEENRPVALGAAKQRALLALLLLRANEVVSSDRLVEELWGERPPAKAANFEPSGWNAATPRPEITTQTSTSATAVW